MEVKKKEQFHSIAFFSDMFYLVAVKKKKLFPFTDSKIRSVSALYKTSTN